VCVPFSLGAQRRIGVHSKDAYDRYSGCLSTNPGSRICRRRRKVVGKILVFIGTLFSSRWGAYEDTNAHTHTHTPQLMMMSFYCVCVYVCMPVFCFLLPLRDNKESLLAPFWRQQRKHLCYLNDVPEGAGGRISRDECNICPKTRQRVYCLTREAEGGGVP
jgi:hypothetical protein